MWAGRQGPQVLRLPAPQHLVARAPCALQSEVCGLSAALLCPPARESPTLPAHTARERTRGQGTGDPALGAGAQDGAVLSRAKRGLRGAQGRALFPAGVRTWGRG